VQAMPSSLRLMSSSPVFGVGSEFAINPWKAELVGEFFLNRGRAGKVVKYYPFVLEDCDVSSICAPSDVDTTYDDDVGKTCDVITPRHSDRENIKSNISSVQAMPSSLRLMSSSPVFGGSPDISSPKVSQDKFATVSSNKLSTSVRSSIKVEISDPALITPDMKVTTGKQSIPDRQDAHDKGDVLDTRMTNEGVSLASKTRTSVSVSPIIPGVVAVTQSAATETESSNSQVVAISEQVSTPSPISSTRPVLIRKTSPKKVLSMSPTLSVPPKVSSDQGRNCASIILKSSRLSPKLARLNTVLQRQKQVSQLVSSFPLKFSHASSPGVQVRLDYCFNKPESARQFFKAVCSLVQSHSSPRLLSCILLSEEELGYRHLPVLTEHDLLAIQSSEYCRNIFRTSILIKVVLKEDTVVYHFKTVTDINRFLYNKSGSVNTRSLGLLRKNVVPKRLVPDDQGSFRLFTAGVKIPEKIGNKHKFKINGPFLLFSSKLNLFKFLVSEDASEIEHLQFDEVQIKDFAVSEESMIHKTVQKFSNDGSKVNKVVVNYPCEKDVGECDKIEIKGNVEVVKNFGEKTSVVITRDCKPEILDEKVKLELEGIESEKVKKTKKPEEEKEHDNFPKSLLAQKEEEIRNLKKKLYMKEKIIQTKFLEKTAAKSSLKKALSQLDQINQLSQMSAGKTE